jgi:hypothetical protein
MIRRTYQEALMRFIALLMIACAPAWAQEGHLGHSHDKWHADFYSKLIRKDTNTSCCSLADCRPTTSRVNGGVYEVKVDGQWVRVDQSVIQNLAAPDGGAHVCAPKQEGQNKGKLYCVVLPPDF